jgi:hypothetical protein
VGGPLPLFEIYQREPSCLLFQLGRLAGRLPWLQCAALIELLAVTLDRCSVNAETAGGFALGDALLHDPTIYSLRSIEYALMLLYFYTARRNVIATRCEIRDP